jgi:hypothetical protein
VTNKRVTTKLTPNQSTNVKVKFVQLKALITNMVTQVKSKASRSRKVKDKKKSHVLVQMLTRDIFWELDFQSQWPQTKLCQMFQEIMMIRTNSRFLKQSKCFLQPH